MPGIFASLFPARCIKCSKVENGLCISCRKSLQITRGADLPYVDACWSAGPYSGWLREAVLSYKSGRISALDGLADALQLVLHSTSFGPDFIVNIPSTVDKVRDRGFDTIGELSSALAKRTKLQHRPVLQFTRKIQDQVGLDRNARNENLASAFTARALISGQIALIDDVITTGATVMAAAKSLRICGATKIYAISLCRT